MATSCPTCHSPVDGPYCSTCGNPVPGAAAVVAAPAPPKAKQRRQSAAGARAANPPARNRGKGISWGLTALVAAVTFALGMAAGYALSLARGMAPTGDEAGQSPLTLASRYLDEGTQQMSSGSREAAAATFRKALRNWELALQENPENLYVRTYLGLTQFYLGEEQAAFATLKEVLERDPNYLWALFNMAWMSEVLGDNTSALAYYERYLAAAPTEQVQAGKYAEQPGLIERQVEAAREAVAKLTGTAPVPVAPQIPLPDPAPAKP